MNEITTLTVLTVCFVGMMLIPTAVAENIEYYEQALEELNKKYGIPTEPELTEEQWAEYEKRVQAIHAEYDSIHAEIEKKIAAIDAEFGLAPWPELTEEQWAAYNNEIDQVFKRMDSLYMNNAKNTSISDESLEFNKKLADINEKYGIPTEPELTEEQWAEYEKRVQAIHAEYDSLHVEIDKKIAAIDAEFGLAPTDPDGDGDHIGIAPALTDEKWIEYDKRIQAVYQEYSDIWEEIDAKIAKLDAEFGIEPYSELSEEQWSAYNDEIMELYNKTNPYEMTTVDKAALEELEEQLAAIDKKYGLPPAPALTDEKWIEYDKRIQAVYQEYENIWKEIDAKITKLDAEFGIEPYPDISPDVWEKYYEELSALLAKFDVEQTFGAASSGSDGTIYTNITSAEREYQKQFVAIFSSFGFVDFDDLEEDLPATFWRGLETLDEKYVTHLDLVGDPYTTENKTESYKILSSEYIPAVQELCGDIKCIPSLTPSQIEELDKQLSDLQKRFDSGEL